MKPKFDINNYENLNNRDIILECEFCEKEFNSTKKYIKRALSGNSRNAVKYCSRVCSNKGSMTGKYVNCSVCNKEIYRNKKEINKNGIFYCSGICRGIDFNRNKNWGGNRSKIELFIEEELINRYNFEMLFNDRKILTSNYELDIYIPMLKLAFELNGIFHYDPIFGNDKLKIIKEKDLFKISECYKNKIELIVIDISDIKHFSIKQGEKYLNYIIKEIDTKLGDVNGYLSNGQKRKLVEKRPIKKCECGIEISNRSLRCRSCSNKNKKWKFTINKPSYEQLLLDVENLGYKKTGEKYKVDRTTIYQWIKKYRCSLAVDDSCLHRNPSNSQNTSAHWRDQPVPTR